MSLWNAVQYKIYMFIYKYVLLCPKIMLPRQRKSTDRTNNDDQHQKMKEKKYKEKD